MSNTTDNLDEGLLSKVTPKIKEILSRQKFLVTATGAVVVINLFFSFSNFESIV